MYKRQTTTDYNTQGDAENCQKEDVLFSEPCLGCRVWHLRGMEDPWRSCEGLQRFKSSGQDFAERRNQIYQISIAFNIRSKKYNINIDKPKTNIEIHEVRLSRTKNSDPFHAATWQRAPGWRFAARWATGPATLERHGPMASRATGTAWETAGQIRGWPSRQTLEMLGEEYGMTKPWSNGGML